MIKVLYFFISIIFITLFEISAIGIKGNFVNRTFKDMPLTLIKNSVSTDLVDEKVTCFFDKQTLEDNVKNYLKINLEKKVSKYKISFFYYLFEENEPVYDFTDEPQNVQIHFNCAFYKTYEVNQYMTFEIDNLWS